MKTTELVDFLNPLMAMVGWMAFVVVGCVLAFCVLGFLEESYRALRERARRLDHGS